MKRIVKTQVILVFLMTSLYHETKKNTTAGAWRVRHGRKTCQFLKKYLGWPFLQTDCILCSIPFGTRQFGVGQERGARPDLVGADPRVRPRLLARPRRGQGAGTGACPYIGPYLFSRWYLDSRPCPEQDGCQNRFFLVPRLEPGNESENPPNLARI